MSWLRAATSKISSATPVATSSEPKVDADGRADFSDGIPSEDEQHKSFKGSHHPVVYSRHVLLQLWHPQRRAKNLPVELLGHETAAQDGEWTEAGHSDARHRHRTSSSEQHMSMGSGRLNGGLRGRGGTGLQGGVLSGLGSAKTRSSKVEDDSRARARSFDEHSPPEKWTPRKLDTSASAGAWRRTTDTTSHVNDTSTQTILEESHEGTQTSAATWEDEPEPQSPLEAFQHKQSSTTQPKSPWGTLGRLPDKPPVMAHPLPQAATPQPPSNGSPSVEQTAPLRQSISRVSALSLEDELYEDPLLNRRRGSGSTPLSRSASSREPFGTATPGPVLAPPLMSKWCYRDPSGSLQGPFSAAQMHDWHSQGFFSEDLMLNRIGESEFMPLGILLRMVVEPDKPFTSSLRQHAMPEPPPFQHAQQAPPWQQNHMPASARQFTTDYDPFAHRQQASPALPNDHYGKPLSRQVSASTDPWGVPIRQESPQSFATPQPEPWHLPSASSSRQASYSHSFPAPQLSTQAPQYSLGSFQSSVSQARHESPAWHSVPQSTASFDEMQPLLRPNEVGSILPAASGEPKYSASPIASETNLYAIGQGESRRASLVPETTLSAAEAPTIAPVDAMSPPVRNELDAQLDAMVIKPVEQPEEPVSPAPPAVPKGKSKRQAAKEAKEAARRAAEDATMPQPSDLPAPSNAALSKPAGVLPLEPDPDSGWHIAGPEKTVQPLPPASSPSLSKKAAPAPWAAGREETSGTSLRDIQAKEAKQSQARKAAEKQQRAAATAAEAAQLAAAAAENKAALPGSSSWANGLSEQSPSAWSKPSAPPVNGKSLKDIQEEEARQKAARAASSAPQPRAAYAGSVGQPKPIASTSSGPWMTVGTGGKVTAPPPGVSRPSASAQPVRPSAPLKSVSSNATAQTKLVNEKPPAPSPDLLKWVRSALQGFSANLDDFLKLLFDFPLDPDEFILEIISDQVYANSKTLDGKRFASEFVSRRKADARGVPGGKVSSMADAVRTQPTKPVAENFKVVKKSKKAVK